MPPAPTPPAGSSARRPRLRRRARLHLSADLLARAERGAVPAWMLACQAVAHLGELCPTCREALAAFETRGSARALDRLFGGDRQAAYRQAVTAGFLSARIAAKVAFTEPAGAAEAAVRELLGEPADARLARVRSDRRLHTLAAWERLHLRTEAALVNDAVAAEVLAQLALAAASPLDDDRYGRGLTEDCRAITSIALARARLAQGRLDAARQGLWIAQGFGGEGSGDPYVRAELMLLQADLHQAEGLHRESADFLELAARIYAGISDPLREGAARLRQGIAFREVGDAEAARAALEAAVALLSTSEEREALTAAEAARLALLLDTAEVPPAGTKAESGDEHDE